MPFVTVPDGTRLYYEEVGTGEPLLLISGNGRDHTDWNGVRDDFAGRYRVIVYDHRGIGQSDKPDTPPYTTRGLAQDAVALLDHLGVARAHVYGHSMGGMISQWLGIEHAEHIGALVLGATGPGNITGNAPGHGVSRTEEVKSLLSNLPPRSQEHLKAILSLVYSPAWIMAHPELMQGATSSIPEYVVRLQYQAVIGHDAWDRVPDIHAPTLVIHGSEDQQVPTANASLLAERIAGAQLHIVKGGRHAYFVEFRKEASRVVNSFLARHPLS
ncbi:alpha/beta hydrolase [Reticulibacter mediterranei]|uniref:Alpha/beta hydrolase n=1 Tax=Reticulibacter mediterranei TaxID=2778369 RepID=A0A8J3N6G7_9CHLR|nr:alpha/beta fold hydrolase [Reticulibacter mediterranei]GHP00180.1 alpha/beta hydrolase [Reticulibacter mediterranei]